MLPVTRLVRASRLPATFSDRLRPHAKAVLLALADDCRTLDLAACPPVARGARPTLATLVRETELSRNTVIGQLRRLRAAGFILEQTPPGQHRARTWALNLAVVAARIDPEAWLSEADTQLVQRLTGDLSGPDDHQLDLWPEQIPEVQFRPPEVQLVSPEVQFRPPEVQLAGGDSQCELHPNCIERSLNGTSITAAQAPLGAVIVQTTTADPRRHPPPEALATLQAIKAKVFAKSALRPQRVKRHA